MRLVVRTLRHVRSCVRVLVYHLSTLVIMLLGTLQDVERREMSGAGGYGVGQMHDTNDVKDACVGGGLCSEMRWRGSLNAESDAEVISWIMCKNMV
jgi:hypothetical protein